MSFVDDITAITQFIIELEKLKKVERRIKPVGLARYENSAEHSWHIALFALTLMRFAPQPLDELKVVTMLLLHDIVEIDTGDKFAYDANHDDFANEHKAAIRLFGLLPESCGQTFLLLWEEFEQAQSAEAQFAKAIDRLMPVLQNLHNGCQSWLAHGVSVKQILAKNAAIEQASPQLWQWLSAQVIEKAKEVGLKSA
ncbi:HD domain-containing protein [Paraglaciecola sp.]|uniref:HD domain-containing protein n=1 Tax=Paraglaciecola sp. TaxID=1920173 RepID=UPI0030F3B3F0